MRTRFLIRLRPQLAGEEGFELGLNMKRHPKEKSEGRVTDAMTGDPIEGVEVTLPTASSVYVGITGRNGHVKEWQKREKRTK